MLSPKTEKCILERLLLSHVVSHSYTTQWNILNASLDIGVFHSCLGFNCNNRNRINIRTSNEVEAKRFRRLLLTPTASHDYKIQTVNASLAIARVAAWLSMRLLGVQQTPLLRSLSLASQHRRQGLDQLSAQYASIIVKTFRLQLKTSTSDQLIVHEYMGEGRLTYSLPRQLLWVSNWGAGGT